MARELIGGLTGGENLYGRGRAPGLPGRDDGRFNGLGWNTPRAVVLLHSMGIAVDRDQGAGPLGVGNREPDRAQARPTLGHHSGPLETHGVKHGDESASKIS